MKNSQGPKVLQPSKIVLNNISPNYRMYLRKSHFLKGSDTFDVSMLLQITSVLVKKKYCSFKNLNKICALALG